MAKVVKYKVWIHIEGLDKYGDCVEGDSHFEPREAAVCKTSTDAMSVRDCLLGVAELAAEIKGRLVVG